MSPKTPPSNQESITFESPAPKPDPPPFEPPLPAPEEASFGPPLPEPEPASFEPTEPTLPEPPPWVREPEESAVGAEAVAQVLADLDPDQRLAVTHGAGPLLVVAGAGT